MDRAVEAERDVFEARIEELRGVFLVEKSPIGGEQGGDAVAFAILDAIENLAVHEGLAEADEHHVLAGMGGILDQPLEDFVDHIFFGLLMRFARTHGAIQIALGGGLDDVLDGKRGDTLGAAKIAPQKFRAVPEAHEVLSSHEERVRKCNEAGLREGAKYVLYWAQMNRRVEWNHALGFAAELANRLGLPVLFYEGLTCTYAHANDRMHTFLLEGVPETARRAAKVGLGYVFHLRRRRSDRNDALYQLAADAAAVVTDDYPAFIARENNARVPGRIRVAYYAVDSSCIVPMSRFEKREYAAYTIRPKIRPDARRSICGRWRRCG